MKVLGLFFKKKGRSLHHYLGWSIETLEEGYQYWRGRLISPRGLVWYTRSYSSERRLMNGARAAIRHQVAMAYEDEL